MKLFTQINVSKKSVRQWVGWLFMLIGVVLTFVYLITGDYLWSLMFMGISLLLLNSDKEEE